MPSATAATPSRVGRPRRRGGAHLQVQHLLVGLQALLGRVDHRRQPHQHRADQADEGAAIGEDPDHVGARKRHLLTWEGAPGQPAVKLAPSRAVREFAGRGVIDA
jgi:hypothetical protein